MQRREERLLGDAAPERMAITVLGAGPRGRSARAMTVDLTRDDVRSTLDEFLPIAAPGDVAIARDRRAGLRELGLPCETDPAITRHLAAFLASGYGASPVRLPIRSAVAAATIVVDVAGRHMVRPDLVLFNGGFFTPETARDRVSARARRHGSARRPEC